MKKNNIVLGIWNKIPSQRCDGYFASDKELGSVDSCPIRGF